MLILNTRTLTAPPSAAVSCTNVGNYLAAVGAVLIAAAAAAAVPDLVCGTQ